MNNKESIYFNVLFTKQKRQKRKIWEDGKIEYRWNGKALLYAYNEDEENTKKFIYLGSKFFMNRNKLCDGEQLEFDQHLVEIDSRCEEFNNNNNNNNSNVNNNINNNSHVNQKPTMKSLVSNKRSSHQLRTTTKSNISFNSLNNNSNNSKMMKMSMNKPSLISRKSNNNMNLSCLQFLPIYSDQLYNNAVPNQFNNLIQYRKIYTDALVHELNIRMKDIATKVQNTIQNKDAIVELHNLKKRTRFPYYDMESCQLIVRKPKAKSWKKNWRQRKFRQDYNETKSEANVSITKGVRYFLKIDKQAQEHSTKYSRDDVWIISSTPTFQCNLNNNQPNNLQYVLFFTSLYYGPSRDGFMEMRPFLNQSIPKRLLEQQHVYCIRGINASSEVAMLDTLSMMEKSQVIISHLLSNNTSLRLRNNSLHQHIGMDRTKSLFIHLPKIDCELLTKHQVNIRRKFHLNIDQRTVLVKCKQWFINMNNHNNHIQLVHGTFGSGKSLLLVALVIFLNNVLDEIDPDGLIRILISAQTNVAVDRILLGLLKHGFSLFTRVGSLRRIAKPLLKNVLHYSGRASDEPEKHDEAALKELKDMLRLSTSADEKQILEDAITDLKQQCSEKRANVLKKMRVVGVTCAATTFPILDDNKYSIVILDECSQMIEPMSLLSLIKFDAERVVAVGDPNQLPPNLSSTRAVNTKVIGTSDDTNLSKTLFVRLAAFYKPTMLRTQYRCHSNLSAFSNKQFYENKLINGISNSERCCVINNLPTLIFCDMANGQEQIDRRFAGSISNVSEMRAVNALCGALLHKGVQPKQIGIICLYKAQLQLLKPKIQSILSEYNTSIDYDDNPGTLQLATVDAFQGGEKDIIILTCCRTKGIGFIAAPQRMNVALTRAKRHLFVVGRAQTLQEHHLWKNLIVESQKAGNFFSNLGPILSKISSSTLCDTVLNDSNSLNSRNDGTEAINDDGNINDDYDVNDDDDDEHLLAPAPCSYSSNTTTNGAITPNENITSLRSTSPPLLSVVSNTASSNSLPDTSNHVYDDDDDDCVRKKQKLEGLKTITTHHHNYNIPPHTSDAPHFYKADNKFSSNIQTSNITNNENTNSHSNNLAQFSIDFASSNDILELDLEL